ncbi:MAG: hypothetical protein MHM6MM_008564, partial [Cercozoa sp. M6MM]
PPHQVRHTVPGVAYGFSERRKKLKAEYAHLSGPEIAELRLSGTVVQDDVDIPLFLYTGDSSIEILTADEEQQQRILSYPVVITECTFLEDELLDWAQDAGHICWCELAPFVKQNPHTVFVLVHFSLRYTRSQIREFFDNLPGGLPHNVVLWAD